MRRWEDGLDDLVARKLITRASAKSALDTLDVRKVLRASKNVKRPGASASREAQGKASDVV